MAIYTQPKLPIPNNSSYYGVPRTRFFYDLYRATTFMENGGSTALHPPTTSNYAAFDFKALRLVRSNYDSSSTGSVDGEEYTRYKELMEASEEGIASYDLYGRIAYYNKEQIRNSVYTLPQSSSYTARARVLRGAGNSIIPLNTNQTVELAYYPDYPYNYQGVLWTKAETDRFLSEQGYIKVDRFLSFTLYSNGRGTAYGENQLRNADTTSSSRFRWLMEGTVKQSVFDPNSEGSREIHTTTSALAGDQYWYDHSITNTSNNVSARTNNICYVLKKYGIDTILLEERSSTGARYVVILAKKTEENINKFYNILRALPFYISDDLNTVRTYNIPLWNVPETTGEGVWEGGTAIPNPDEPDRGGQPENEYEDVPSWWDPDNPNIDNSNESDTIEEGNPTIVPVGQTHRFYAMTTNQVDNLITFIWSPDVESGLRKVYNTPSDTIFSCRMYPLPIDEIANLGEPVNVKLGNLVATNAAGYLLNDVQCRYDMGSYHLKEYFGNFLDYGGHTKVEIYLPYIGFRNLDTDDVMGKVISVSYIIDIVNGNCTAEVSADGNVVSVFDGNICVSLSIKSTNEDIIAAQNRAVAVNTAVTGVSNIISDFSRSIGKGIGSVVKAGASAYDSAIAIKNSRSNISRMGSASPFSNLYLPQEVFLVISRPRQSLPSNYGETYGYPCNITSQLNGVTGFTICDRVRLEGCPATREEKEAIINALSNGVIL